jgi:hypothetical protein
MEEQPQTKQRNPQNPSPVSWNIVLIISLAVLLVASLIDSVILRRRENSPEEVATNLYALQIQKKWGSLNEEYQETVKIASDKMQEMRALLEFLE